MIKVKQILVDGTRKESRVSDKLQHPPPRFSKLRTVSVHWIRQNVYTGTLFNLCVIDPLFKSDQKLDFSFCQLFIHNTSDVKFPSNSLLCKF